MFKYGAKVYEDSLRFDSIGIITSLEKEIQSIKQDLDSMEKKKVAKVKSLLSLFNQDIPSTFCDAQPKNADHLKLALATIRKLPAFGFKAAKIDFEWPTERDLMMMPKGKPISILKLKWKRSRIHEQSIGAF